MLVLLLRFHLASSSWSSTRTRAVIVAPTARRRLSSDGSQRTALQVAQENRDVISGKTFLITGAYSGIGVTTTQALLAMNAGSVIVGGRNAQLQDDFTRSLQCSNIDGDCTIDLGDLQSVKTFADHVLRNHDRLDRVILNAGVMMTPPGLTKDGFETQMGINVIGHFLLAKLLLPLVQESQGRYVWLSSAAHLAQGSPAVDIEYYRNFRPETSPYNPMLQYQQSKLGDILLAKEFAKRHAVESVSAHPGVIRTNLSRNLTWMDYLNVAYNILFVRRIPMKTPEQGAATTLTCATNPTIVNGEYYADCAVAPSSDSAKNEGNAAALYEYCDEVTKEFQ